MAREVISPWFSEWGVNKDVNLIKTYYLEEWRSPSEELKIQKEWPNSCFREV